MTDEQREAYNKIQEALAISEFALSLKSYLSDLYINMTSRPEVFMRLLEDQVEMVTTMKNQLIKQYPESSEEIEDITVSYDAFSLEIETIYKNFQNRCDTTGQSLDKVIRAKRSLVTDIVSNYGKK